MPVPYPWLRPQLRPEFLECTSRYLLSHDAARIAEVAKYQRLRRADLDATRLLPALIEQVCTKGAFHRGVGGFIPVDRPIRAGRHQVALAGRPYGVNDHDAIGPTRDPLVARRTQTRSVLTVQAQERRVGDLDARTAAPLAFLDVNPAMARLRLRHGERCVVNAHMFVAAGKKTVVTADTAAHIDHHGVAAHDTSPVHLATWIKQEFEAIPAAFFDTMRPGVSTATHPPRSGESGLPGSIRSYFADDAKECTTPLRTRPVTTAMHSTVPRSLNSLTISPSAMPRAAASPG